MLLGGSEGSVTRLAVHTTSSSLRSSRRASQLFRTARRRPDSPTSLSPGLARSSAGVNALTWPAEVADEEARPTPAAAVTGLQHSCHAVSEPWTPADYREKPATAPFLPPRMKPAAPSVPRGKQALNPGAQRWTPPAGPTTATGKGNAISTPAPMPLNVGLAASIHAGPALNPGKAKQQERRKGPAAAPSISPHKKLAVNPGVKRWVVPTSVLEDKQEYMDFKPEPLPTTNGGLAASKHAR